jgi:hypothetical protein
MNLNQDSQATSIFDVRFDYPAEDRRPSTSASDRRPVEPNWTLDDFEETYKIRVFDYLSQHAEEMQIFAEAMSSFSAQIGAAVAEAYDFSAIQNLGGYRR